MAATIVRSKGVQTQPSTAFRLKCNREFQRLQNKLQFRLRHDLSRCFEESLHSDFTFITNTRNIPTHTALLQVRVPLFYEKLRPLIDNSTNYLFIPHIESEKLAALLRRVYTKDLVEDEEFLLIESVFEADDMTEHELTINCNQFLDESVESENANSSIDLKLANNNGGQLMDDSGIDDSLLSNRKRSRSCSEHEVHGKAELSLLSSLAFSDSMNGSTGSDSMFATDFNASFTSESTFSTLQKDDNNDQNGETETDHTVDQEVGESDCDDKVRTLIRRDTFDLIDPSLAEDESAKSDKDDKDDDANDGQVIWSVGGDVIATTNYANNDEDSDNFHMDEERVAIPNASSGSENNPNSSEVSGKEEGLPFSGSTSMDGVSLSNSFTATMYRSMEEPPSLLPVPIENLNSLGSKKITILEGETTSNVRPKELPVEPLYKSKSPQHPEPEEIIYLARPVHNQCVQTPDKMEDCASSDKINELPASSDWAMRRSSSKMFSPDSIVSDRSPLLERAAGFLHNTVQIMPILTDTSDIPNSKLLVDKRSISRKSSESVSPEADSLNLDIQTPHDGNKKHLGSFIERDSMVENVIEEVDEMNHDVLSNLREQVLAQSDVEKPAAKITGENVPILSGFHADVPVEQPAEEPKQEPPAKPGSFFVFIDINSPSVKSMERKKMDHLPRRRRVLSCNAADETLLVNRSISMDNPSTHKDSGDEAQSERSAKLGTSPKTPSSVYMYIDAGSSQKNATNRRTQSRRATQEVGSSFAKGHVRNLSHGQEPLYLNSLDLSEKPKNSERAIQLKVKEKSIEQYETPSPEPDDDIETVYSEVSECSTKERHNSVGIHDEEYSSLSQVPCTKLGEDLLRMFLEQVNTDVVIRVGGKDIKAHKCILSSRCSYFAAMLSGGWLESSGNVITLRGYSYTTVHFALCHIYSGATKVPKEVDITELASIADMMGLEGLKDVVALTLKAKYCHFFHKPCSGCLSGVLECLPICASCGLEELYDKCIRWITRHIARTWQTKAFATLPEELLNKCYHAAKAEISVESILDTIMICDKLMGTLPHVKWAEPVFGLASKMMEACTMYLAKNLHLVLGSRNFLALGKGQSWNVNALEETFLVALENLTPDSACLSYVKVAELLGSDDDKSTPDAELIENFIDLLQKIQRQVERYLIHNANRVVHCHSWAKLTPEMQKRIKDAAVIVFEFGKPTAPPPRLTSLNRRFNRGKTHSPAERSESSTTSSSSGRTAGSRQHTRSSALPVSKTSTYPLPSRMAITPPAPKQSGFQVKKSPMDTQRSLTPNNEGRKLYSRESGSSKTSSMLPTANRHSDILAAPMRKTGSRERISNSRPKSWPNKDKSLVPIKTKDSSKEFSRPQVNAIPLRSRIKSNTTTASTTTSSRPHSAVFLSETGDASRPPRSLTSSALRDTRSPISKKQGNEGQESTSKQKTSEKTRSHGGTFKKSHAKDDGKTQHSNSRRPTAERSLKASTGNKG